MCCGEKSRACLGRGHGVISPVVRPFCPVATLVGSSVWFASRGQGASQQSILQGLAAH